MHTLKYRFKCIFRNKIILFWTLIFPIVLSTLFHLAFSNIYSGEIIQTIPVGFVKNDFYYENQQEMDSFLQLASSLNVRKDVKLFEITYYESSAEARQPLDDFKISAIIEMTDFDAIHMYVVEDDMNQTIVKSFLDEYLQVNASIQSIVIRAPEGVDVEKLAQSFMSPSNYMQEVDRGTNTPNVVLIYFYTLIGMALVYGSFWGATAASSLQPNLSEEGKRVAISPANRLHLLLLSFFAAFLVHMAETLVFLLYLVFALNVDFGSDIGFILLTCVAGSLSGITFGAFLATSLNKVSEGVKVGISSLVGVLGGFLSGMMNTNVKYYIQTNIPFLQYINPVNLITDALYSLYYFPTYERFALNIVILFAMTIVFTLGTYLFFRRDRYESI